MNIEESQVNSMSMMMNGWAKMRQARHGKHHVQIF